MNHDKLLRIKDFIRPIVKKKKDVTLYGRNNFNFRSFLNIKPCYKNKNLSFQRRFFKNIVSCQHDISSYPKGARRAPFCRAVPLHVPIYDWQSTLPIVDWHDAPSCPFLPLRGTARHCKKGQRGALQGTAKRGIASQLRCDARQERRLARPSIKIFRYSISKSSYTIVRPLINFSRYKITMACILFFLPVYPDLSNLKIIYSRNRIRKQIIPTIQFFLNPKAEKALFQFSEFYNRDILGF